MTRAAEKLRRAKLAAGMVTVFTNTYHEPQYTNSISYELAYSNDSTDELLG